MVVAFHCRGILPPQVRIMNQSIPRMREIGQQLLALECAEIMPSVYGNCDPSTLFGVCEALRQPLSALTGASGFHILLARALTLSKKQIPALTAVTIDADGKYEMFPSFPRARCIRLRLC